MTKLAVVGDIHGALAECFQVLPRLEERHGPIVGILQAGDLGVFAHDSPLDKATRRFAALDPTELGLAPFLAGIRTAPLPLWFTRGNHEDFELLRRLGPTIDPAGQLHHLTDGIPTNLHGFRLIPVGGIDGTHLEAPPEPGGMYFGAAELDLACSSPGQPDILLTHAGPTGYSVIDNTLAGSDGLRTLVEILAPRWHFFGHHGHPPRPAKLGETWIVPLNQPDVLRVPGRDGGFGLLDLEARRFDFVMPDESLCSLEEIASLPCATG